MIILMMVANYLIFKLKDANLAMNTKEPKINLEVEQMKSNLIIKYIYIFIYNNY